MHLLLVSPGPKAHQETCSTHTHELSDTDVTVGANAEVAGLEPPLIVPLDIMLCEVVFSIRIMARVWSSPNIQTWNIASGYTAVLNQGGVAQCRWGLQHPLCSSLGLRSDRMEVRSAESASRLWT